MPVRIIISIANERLPSADSNLVSAAHKSVQQHAPGAGRAHAFSNGIIPLGSVVPSLLDLSSLSNDSINSMVPEVGCANMRQKYVDFLRMMEPRGSHGGDIFCRFSQFCVPSSNGFSRIHIEFHGVGTTQASLLILPVGEVPLR